MEKTIISGLCATIKDALSGAQMRLEINDYEGEEAKAMQDCAAALAAMNDLEALIAADPTKRAALEFAESAPQSDE